MADMVIRDPSTQLGMSVVGKAGDGHGVVEAIIQPEIEHVSETDELAFSWVQSAYNYAAGDTILLVRNTDSDRDLHLVSLTFHSDTTTNVVIHTTDGAAFTPTGTAITGVNLNRKSGKEASATAIGDETANTQGNILWAGSIGSDDSKTVPFAGAVILGNGDNIAIDFVQVGGEASATITGFYEDA